MSGTDPIHVPRPAVRSSSRAVPLILVAAGALVLGGAAGVLISGRSGPPAAVTAPAVAPDEHAEETGVIEMTPAAMANVGLQTAVVEMRPASRVFRTTGVVTPNQGRVAHIRPLARGRIEEVLVDLGQRVGRGEALAAYDNIELGEVVGEYAGAVATLREAEAGAEAARRSLERARSLVAAGAIALGEVERREAELADALAAVNRQQAQIAGTDEKLHRFGMTEEEIARLRAELDAGTGAHRLGSLNVLAAPFDGTIIAFDLAEGETVDPGRELFTVADLSTVWVLADVYEKDIAAVEAGRAVRISVNAYPGEVIDGRITHVSDLLDPATRTVKVRAEAPNPEGRLKLGMFATVEIPFGGAREVLMAPAAAIQQIDAVPVAFVMEEPGHFERRPLLLGEESGGWVEILEGLAVGEPVVTTGSFHLKSMLLRERIGDSHGH